jgi:ABC-type cobalamin/Fe3+-siderophores transport system ATPase subunit
MNTATNTSASEASPYLSVDNVEVIYDHVILVLKGVSLQVPKGGIVALLGANGAGKSTTLKSISNLLGAERGDVTKGSIEFKGVRIEQLTPERTGQARRHPGDGGTPLFRAPHGRGKPAHRRLHAQDLARRLKAASTRFTTIFRDSRSAAVRRPATRRAANSR